MTKQWLLALAMTFALGAGLQAAVLTSEAVDGQEQAQEQQQQDSGFICRQDDEDCPPPQPNPQPANDEDGDENGNGDGNGDDGEPIDDGNGGGSGTETDCHKGDAYEGPKPGGSILDELYGDLDAIDKNCECPCRVEFHQLQKEADGTYMYQFRGVVEVPYAYGTTGSIYSRRRRIPDNPGMNPQERADAQAYFDLNKPSDAEPNRGFFYQADTCKDHCQCVLKRRNGNPVPVPNTQPDVQVRTVWVPGPVITTPQGEKFKRYFQIRTRTRRTQYQGDCRAGGLWVF